LRKKGSTLEKTKNQYKTEKTKVKGNQEGKAVQEARAAYENAKKTEQAVTAQYNVAQLQIPLVVFGLQRNEYLQRLEMRPKTAAKSEWLLTMALDPAAWLKGVEREKLLDSSTTVIDHFRIWLLFEFFLLVLNFYLVFLARFIYTS